MTQQYSPPFEPGLFYHVFNRGNNKEKIFFSDENYRYFLTKFDEYLSDYLQVYAFCLLVNHFHFLVRIKEEEDLSGFQNLPGLQDLEGLRRDPISQAFSNFFNAYTKAINKQQNRTGSLFQKNFKRVLIDDQVYLLQIIFYIHRNPVHHNICERLEDYPWSSYLRILSDRSTKLMKKAVINIFGDKQSYIAYHQSRLIDFNESKKYLIEE